MAFPALRLRPHADAARALLHRARLRLGDLGLAGLAGALLAVALAGLGLHGLEQERAAVAELAQRAGEPPLPPRVASAGRHDLLERLPPSAQRHADIATLMQISRRHDLSAARTQYRVLDRTAAPVERLEVGIAATQSYESWRAFMVEVLNELPHAAVTSAAWARTDVDSERIEGRLAIVLHHRSAP